MINYELFTQLLWVYNEESFKKRESETIAEESSREDFHVLQNPVEISIYKALAMLP